MITISPESLKEGTKDVRFSQYLSASGGVFPYFFTVIDGSLPPGMNLASDGRIGGIPVGSGFYYFTVEVQDSINETAQQTYQLLINISSNVISVNSQEFTILNGSGCVRLTVNTNSIDSDSLLTIILQTGETLVFRVTNIGIGITPTYSLVNDTIGNIANEGSTITFTLNTTGLAPGTVIPWTITGVQESDIDTVI